MMLRIPFDPRVRVVVGVPIRIPGGFRVLTGADRVAVGDLRLADPSTGATPAEWVETGVNYPVLGAWVTLFFLVIRRLGT